MNYNDKYDCSKNMLRKLAIALVALATVQPVFASDFSTQEVVNFVTKFKQDSRNLEKAFNFKYGNRCAISIARDNDLTNAEYGWHVDIRFGVPPNVFQCSGKWDLCDGTKIRLDLERVENINNLPYVTFSYNNLNVSIPIAKNATGNWQTSVDNIFYKSIVYSDFYSNTNQRAKYCSKKNEHLN